MQTGLKYLLYITVITVTSNSLAVLSIITETS